MVFTIAFITVASIRNNRAGISIPLLVFPVPLGTLLLVFPALFLALLRVLVFIVFIFLVYLVFSIEEYKGWGKG